VRGLVDDLQVALAPKRKEDDGAIAQAAINTLNWNVSVPQNAVSVTVKDGWITLEGSVAWFYQRQVAENSVRHIKGVRGVTNLIVLKQPVSSPNLQSKIEAAFKRNAEVDAERINVVTSDGRVTLKGSVRSWAERESAEDAVWAAPGVTDVKNEIAVEGVW
jgi:osmotically-inducible protein OsmY